MASLLRTRGQRKKLRRRSSRLAERMAYREAHDPSREQTIEETPLVLAHGLFGSSLVHRQTKRKRFPRLKHIIGWHTPNDLALPMAWDDNTGLQLESELEPGRVVYSVKGMGVYRGFIDWAEQCGRPFYVFEYDWRRDGLESAERLYHFVKDIHQRAKGRKVQIVGHSFGGVLALSMIGKFNPGFVHSVVLAASPITTGCNMLERFQHGYPLANNPNCFAPAVVGTFTAFYSFFSSDPAKCELYDEEGRQLSVDLFDPDVWRAMKLGRFSAAANRRRRASPRDLDKYHAFLKRALPAAKRLQEYWLRMQPGVVYPDIRVIAGHHEMIGYGATVQRGTGELSFYKSYDHGDGLIGLRHALPGFCQDWHADTYVSEHSHGEVLSDLALVTKALADSFRRGTHSLVV